MTIVSPARPSGRRFGFMNLHIAVRRVTDRIVLTAAFVLLFCFYYARNLFDAFSNLSPDKSELAASRTVSGAELLGFIAIAVLLKSLNADRVLRWWDVAVLAAVAIACIYPAHNVGAIGLTCLGLLFIARKDKRLASLGPLCLGLAWLDFWGPIALSLVKPWLLPIETAFAFVPLSFFGPFSLDGITISNGSGHALDIYEQCSAFHNTVATTFIWLSLIKIQGLDFQFRHLRILAIGIGAVVLLNTARISVMATSEHQYYFWHLGPGLWLVKLVMLSAVLGLFYFGLRPAPSRAAG
jgi:hypothetical protein